ncbi:hypothetical protein BOTBODRAFT_34530 [Botryobasidium botryosum FD-172 SS1]|uniref:Major facilitator superfamily (MFS) profile domain-containing protein n=1 Tax=Botryobasidium botryosum (strain FD-172 SS1) TaxID=930990 RepID=A0A067M903_BOTB1|nr:hypothetical protein BOTBODRAFT_34530 [Botryobasidium botryosum FD-172 SS1]
MSFDKKDVEKDSEKDSASSGVMAKQTGADVAQILDEQDEFGTTLLYTEKEERALVRKIDWRIMPAVTLLYMSNFIDRTNIGNANVAGLSKDLKLVGYQYNIGLSVFYIFYALSEVPSNLLLKRLGANIWIPVIVLVFGFVTMMTAWVRNFGGFIVIRTILGLAEGGMMPGVTYYLSTWYKRDELTLRIGIFVSASSMAGAFGGLLATALLKIPQLHGLPHGQWRNIFLIEGALTVALGILGFFMLPNAPEKTPMLTERERLVAMERLRAGAAGFSAAEGTEWPLIKRALTSIHNWGCAICFLLVNICIQGTSLFMPTLLLGMGYSPIQAQLHSVPPYVVSAAWSVFIAWASDRSGKRGIWLLITTPIAAMGSAILIGNKRSSIDYLGIFFLTAGVFPIGPIYLSWVTNNAAPYTTRAVSTAMIVSIGSFGPLISAWVYLPTDGPEYIKGNSIQLGAQCLLFIITALLIWYNAWENKARQAGKRDYRLNADEETVSKLGNLHPRFHLTT